MQKVTGRLAKEIEILRRMKDEDIDFTDIPEKTDWSGAVRGKFYRPLKESLTIRIDADVLAWLQSKIGNHKSPRAQCPPLVTSRTMSPTNPFASPKSISVLSK